MARRYAVLLAALLALPAFAGEKAPVTTWTGGEPVGACKSPRVTVEATTGTAWCCASGTWSLCSASSAELASWNFTGNGTTTQFAITGATHGSAELYLVTLSGVTQAPGTDYSVNAATDKITFTVAPANGVPIAVRSLGYARAVNVADTSMVAATGSTTSRTLAARFADEVNVKDFGAIPDDGVDDTAAIQAAVSAVSAAGGGTVVFSRGVYDVRRVRLESHVRLRGDRGAKVKSLEPDASGSGTLYFDNNADLAGVRIEGLSFDGNRAGITEPYHHLVFVLARAGRTVRDVSVVGCDMADAKEDFIRVMGEVGSTVRGVEVTGNRFTNTAGTAISHSGNGVRVYLQASSYAGTYGTVFAEDVRVTNNYSEMIRTLADIKRGVRGFVVADNVARNSHDIAYSVDGSFQGVVADNVALATSAWAATDGQAVSQGIEVQGEGIAIRGNIIERARINGISVTAYAHPDEGAGAQNLSRDISVTGNLIGSVPTHGIKLINPQKFLVTGNHVDLAGFNSVSVDTVAPNAPASGYVGGNFCGSGKVYLTGMKVVYGRGNVNVDGSERFDTASSIGVRIEGQHVEFNPNVHMALTAGNVDRWPGGGGLAVDAATKPDGAYRATTIVDNSAASLAEHALDAYVPVVQNDSVYLTMHVKQNTATTAGVVFKEYDAGGAFISSTFRAITPTASWAKQRLSYTVASASAATVRISLLPATGSNNATPTGNTDIALVRVGKNMAVE